MLKADVAHSSLNFSLKHLLTTTNGSFPLDSGYINISDSLTTSQIYFELNVGKVNTSNELRDKHLKAEEYFSSEKFPKATFNSKSIVLAEGNEKYKYMANGEMNIKGIVKPVTLYFNYNGKQEVPEEKVTIYGFEGTAIINRLDYGVGEEDNLVGNDVTLNIVVEAIK